jgi:SAM-dependent methyltransferase
MDPAVVHRLLALNHDFYANLSEPFARSRARPQPGFQRLLEYLPRPCTRILDVGCGEGRFGRFLQDQDAVGQYVGVDFSEDLIRHARAETPGTYHVRDLSRPGSLEGLGQFPAIACLAVLQHIPGRANRIRLLREMGAHLEQDGRLVLSTWQFLDSERQRRKIAPWGAADLAEADVEANDYLLTWRSGGFGLRYVTFVDLPEITALAWDAGLRLLDHFRADGREGNLNLYTILSGPMD